MTRLLALLAVLAFFLLGGVGEAFAAPTPAQVAYTYDSPLPPRAQANPHYDRGPPSAAAEYHRQAADDRWSFGASARPDSKAAAGYTYHAPAGPAYIDSASTHTAGGLAARARGLMGGPSWFVATGVAANAGTNALRGVDDVLSGLSKGKQSFVRTVPDEGALTRTFGELTEGGTPTTWKNFSGTVIERSDGVQVGLRSYSKSGGSTIDIRMPDGNFYRIHVGQ